MQVIKTAGKVLVAAGAIMLLAAPAMAGNGKGTASGQASGARTQTKSQLKDGSCRDAVEKNMDQLLLAGRAKQVIVTARRIALDPKTVPAGMRLR